MKTDIWMPIFIGDYLKDTQSLTAEEHGAYLLIMMELWVKGGEIPLRTINRIARIDKARWDSEVWPILQDFLTVDDGMVSQNRLTVELKKATSNRETAKKNGATGGRPRGDNKPKNNLGVNPEDNPDPNPEKTSSSSSSSSHSSKPKPSFNIKDFENLSLEYPFLRNESFKELFISHMDSGKKIAKTERAVKMRLKGLHEFTVEEAVKGLEVAIANGYQGVFPKKEGQSQGGFKTALEKQEDEWEKITQSVMGTKGGIDGLLQ